MPNIYFDFDGTLIDSSKRLYNLFCELVPECEFGHKEYWAIKRRAVNQRDFLSMYYGYNDQQINRVHKLWLDRVENQDLMMEDLPADGADHVLSELASISSLYLVTARQNEALVSHQLSRFGWTSYFADVLVTRQKVSKVELIRSKVSEIRGDDCMLGDTGEDILTAKKLGVRSYAVTTGNLNKSVLRSYKPDAIYDNLKDFMYECKRVQQ